MLWAAVSMCSFGFLQSGEVVVPSDTQFDPVVHLSYGDVKVDCTNRPRVLEVRIKVSKMDPFCAGVLVFLGLGIGELCPVSMILDYMVRRGSGARPILHIHGQKIPVTRATTPPRGGII